MKKTLVALTVAALAATSASAATIYNQNGTKLDVKGSLRLALTKETDHRVDLINAGTRIEFDFTQQIGEGFYALGYVQIRPEGKDFGNGIMTHDVYGGFGAENIGQLTFGRQPTTGDDFKLADPEYMGSNVIGDSFMFDSEQKVVKFKSDSFHGLSFGTSYAFDHNAERHDADGKYNENDYFWQAGLFFDQDFGDVNFKANGVFSQVHTSSDYSANTYGLAAAVSYAGFGLGVDYVADSLNKNVLGNTKDRNTWEVAATYKVMDPATLYVMYHQVNNVDFKKDVERKNIAVGADYWIAKNVLTFVEYDTSKEDKKDRDHAYYTGLRVYF